MKCMSRGQLILSISVMSAELMTCGLIIYINIGLKITLIYLACLFGLALFIIGFSWLYKKLA
jgi:hypothetical protein